MDDDPTSFDQHHSLEPFFFLASDPMALVGEDGCFIQVNPAFSRVLGWPQIDVTGCSLVSLLCPDDRPLGEQSVAQALEASESVTFQANSRCSDDSVRFLAWTLKPVRADGSVILYCSAVPVAGPQKSGVASSSDTDGQSVSVSIQRYVEAVENMQDGFHLWQLETPEDAAGFRLRLANPAAAQLLGIDSDWQVGRTMYEVLPALQDTPVPELCRQSVVCSQRKNLGDIDYVTPAGISRTFSVKIFPLSDCHLGVLFVDVTAQRQYQNQLAEQKQRLKILFDHAGVGIAQLTLSGQWMRVNDRLCEILCYEREELLQKNFREITHRDDVAEDLIHYEKLLSGVQDRISLEKRYLRQDGQIVWCYVTASIIRSQRPESGYFIAFIEDITERKRYEQQQQQQAEELTASNLILAKTMAVLERRNQELDEFAYVASHDLKAPLRAISNLAAWLEEDLEGQLPEANRQQLDLLHGRVHRMENLIDGLLAYSRADYSEVMSEPVDTQLLLREVLDSLELPATMTVEIADGMPVLLTSPVPLRHIFFNLIENAAKHHNRADGRIDVQAIKLDNGFYEFVIADDGPGIDPAFQHKIFNIFQVLEARDKAENTGIGLAIVKKLIEGAGGTIAVDSQVGKGAIFRFTWPGAVA